MAQVKSGEGYPKRFARIGQNRAYMKIRTPNSPCTDDTLFFGYFYGFFGRIVDTFEEYIKVIIMQPNVHFFFLLFM